MAKHTPAFWLNTADWKTVAVVKDLNEMADALKKAPVEVVQHHLKNGKNDFAIYLVNFIQNEPDLQAVIAAWSGLSDGVKRQIMKLIESQ